MPVPGWGWEGGKGAANTPLLIEENVGEIFSVICTICLFVFIPELSELFNLLIKLCKAEGLQESFQKGHSHFLQLE